MISKSIQVFDGQSADGNSTSLSWGGGIGTVAIKGNFGGGTVTMQFSPDNGVTWVNTDLAYDAEIATNFRIYSKCNIRLNLAGATSPDLNAWVVFQ